MLTNLIDKIFNIFCNVRYALYHNFHWFSVLINCNVYYLFSLYYQLSSLHYYICAIIILTLLMSRIILFKGKDF